MKGWIVAAGLVLAVSGCAARQVGPIAHYAPSPMTAHPYHIPTMVFDGYHSFDQGQMMFMDPVYKYHGTDRT